MKPGRRLVQLLLVEDSPSDAFLATTALQQTGGGVEVHTVPDGVEALAFLRRESTYHQAPRPDLILLDLNMPRMDGRELLANVKMDRNLKAIPVIVLTSSAAEQDILQAYNLHANCYVVKPADFTEFKRVLKGLATFWFESAVLPPA